MRSITKSKHIWVSLIAGGFLILDVAHKPVAVNAEPVFSADSNAKTVDYKEFAKSVVEGIVLSDEARSVISSVKIKAEQGADISDSVRSNKLAIGKLETARAGMIRFSDSQDKILDASVAGFLTAYDQLIGSVKESLRLQGRLSKAQDKQELDDLLGRASQLSVQAGDSWKLLIYATSLATSALIDSSNSDGGKLAYLKIGSIQKDRLLESLKIRFGDLSGKELAAGQHPTQACAIFLWKFLSQPWKTV